MRTPRRNKEAKFLTPEMAMGRYNLCRDSIIRVARSAGAYLKIGKCVRIDIEKLDDYFSKQYAE